MRHQKITPRLTGLFCSLLMLVLCESCSQYDTHSAGAEFVPTNSQVRQFTHPVYVEFGPDVARVWGPTVDIDVHATIDRTHVMIDNVSDSLALFVYGFAATRDSMAQTDGNVTIQSRKPFALYLNQLSLRSQQGPVIQSTGGGNCYMVLPSGAKNYLYAMQSEACFLTDGRLIMGGTGSVEVYNQSAEGTDRHAVQAVSLSCQYGVKVKIESPRGDAIHLTHGMVRCSQGEWELLAGRHGIFSPQDSIVLTSGKYRGSAREGRFFATPIGAVLRCADLIAASGLPSELMDSAIVAQRYDSVQPVWQQHVPNLTLQADTSYSVYVNSATSPSLNLKIRQTIPAPWVMISDGKIQPSDTLYFRK